MKIFDKSYFNKKDINHYLTYGPMDFESSQAFTYFLIFDLPFMTLFFLIFELFF